MFLRFFDRNRLFNADNTPGAAPGAPAASGAQGGQQFTPPDLNNPELRKWFESQVAGVLNNKNQILEEKRKLEQEHNALLTKVKPLGDLDKVTEALKRLGDDEEKKLLGEGKVEELVSRRIKSAQARYEEALGAKEKELAAERKARETTLAKVKELTIDRALTEAAVKMNVHKDAIEDVIMHGRSVFSLTDDYKIQAVDGSGITIAGPDGRNPLTPEQWVEGLRSKKPHFFPANSGAGARGNNTQTLEGSNGRVIRLRAGYTQQEFEAANNEALKTGARIEFLK